jgi:hypothetical protein
VDGVTPGECLAMSVEQPRLTDAMLASKPFASWTPRRNICCSWASIPRAFGGNKPV